MQKESINLSSKTVQNQGKPEVISWIQTPQVSFSRCALLYENNRIKGEAVKITNQLLSATKPEKKNCKL